LIPFIRKGPEAGHWNWIELLIGVVIWSLGGCAFGWLLSRFLGKGVGKR